MLLPGLGENGIIHLCLEYIPGQDICHRCYHRCQHILGESVATAVIPQIKDKFINILGLEASEHIRQRLRGIEVKRGIGQIADFLSRDIERLVHQNRILVHIHRLQAHSPDITTDVAVPIQASNSQIY